MKKILIICADVPYPPNLGGRVDMWNRIIGLRKLGIQVQLVFSLLSHETMSEDDRKILESHVNDVIQLERSWSLLGLLHPKYPARMISFQVRGVGYRRLKERVRHFDPDVVFLDGWSGYLLARALSRDLCKALVYRTQNIEYKYYWGLVRAAKGLSKLRPLLIATKMRKAEAEIRSTADNVLDISEEDVQEWNSENRPGRSGVLPFIWDFKQIVRTENPGIDVCYIGNMWTPNNVQGIQWFCERVLPLLDRTVRSKLRIVFAGSNPTPYVLDLCRTCGIRCDANPLDISTYLANSRLFIHPVLTSNSTNVKIIEMLTAGRPIVATDQAVRGLPDELKKFVSIATDERAFALAIESGLNSAGGDENRLEILTKLFGLERLRRVVGLIDSVAESKRPKE